MRLPTETARATIAAAFDAGVTIFDTARAYDGNERLVADALRACGAHCRARVVTKGGMAQPGGGWVADGRAKALRADCEASLEALDGLPIDLYLVHAPDPRTTWRTTVRALGRLVDDGLVRAVGVSNVNRAQLDEALAHAPVAAVQVALSPFDERALRGGVVERCEEHGLALLAHSPLGGPKRAPRLVREGRAELALAWLLDLSPVVVPIPGARRPRTAQSAAHAASLAFDDEQRASFAKVRPVTAAERRDGDVVVVMGIPGAGKTRAARALVDAGYVRLNRDERAGSLRELAAALDEQLAAGSARVVLDNTYATRSSRSYVVEAARRHGLPVRCVWLETSLAYAQTNIVERLLDRFGELPTPEQLRALREPGLLAPTSQMRAARELEPPSADEGFETVERVAFERADRDGERGVFVAASAAATYVPDDSGAPHLVFDWHPDGDRAQLDGALAVLRAVVSGPLDGALCPHPAGPPTCWCRPPLPGLPLAFARARGVDPARSVLVGTGPAHRNLAAALGARFAAH
jgi:aryl-alcohol dehydrogenase-like predicted oxidoreductase/predicted kinase